MQKKPATVTLKPPALAYHGRSWERLTRSERQHLLEKGKLTSRDFAALKELGIDEYPSDTSGRRSDSVPGKSEG